MRRASLLALVAVVVAGAVLRFAAADDPSAYQSKDEQAYAMIARGLVSNHTYGISGMDDPVHWVPGAPLLFAAAYRIHPKLNYDGRWDVPAAYPVQAAVGTLTIVAAFVLAFLLAGQIAGLVAAVLVAFYPPLIDASGDLLSEPLGALLATSALAACVWTMRAPGLRRGALAGALLGATVLTRADLALVPLIGAAAVGVVAWRRSEARERRPRARATARAVAPVLAGILVLVLPWTVYASHRAHAFVPLSDGGSSNFFVGTYLPGDGTLFGAKRSLADETRARFPELRDKQWFQLRSRDVIRAVALRRPHEPEEKALRAEGFDNLSDYALGQPLDFAAMMARKIKRLWGGYSRGTYTNPRTWITAIHLFILALGLAGLVAGLALGRRHRAGLGLIGAVLLYVTLLNAILISEARHNLTVMPALACAGAVGAVVAAGALRRRRAAARAPTAPPATHPIL
jgi:hypothetical protein